ncbi:GntR family transcriptional regulator [Roseobacter sp.]|uniref:GntR family transcriptional regulator n=1 Tax=Roseobacter sp. TaxID=1907202 RepID=UPI0025F59083|nr:GntR family transcriptional regulator [Roseobacter sp.]
MMPNRTEYEDGRIIPLTLSAQVADRLRNWVLLGDLAPGEVLVERVLSEKLGVSRTPMREALQMLGREGLIAITPNRRPRVASPGLSDILELLEVHRLVEAHGARLAAKQISQAALTDLQRLLDEMELSGTRRGELEFFELDMAFHRQIVEASGNATLIETHSHLNARLYRTRFLSTQTISGRPLMQAQHTQILEALRARDADRAQARVEEHLHQLGRNITAIFNESKQGKGTGPQPGKTS